VHPDLRKWTVDHWLDTYQLSGGQGVAGSNPAVPTGVMSQDIEDTANLCQGSRCLFLVWVRGVGW
jgi:hypothetical protein